MRNARCERELGAVASEEEPHVTSTSLQTTTACTFSLSDSDSDIDYDDEDTKLCGNCTVQTCTDCRYNLEGWHTLSDNEDDDDTFSVEEPKDGYEYREDKWRTNAQED